MSSIVEEERIIDPIRLVDAIEALYETDLYLQPGPRYAREPSLFYPGQIPESFSDYVEIEEVTSEGIRWSINLGEYENLVGSIKSGDRLIRTGEKYKTKHELVAEAISQEATDQPFRNFFDVIGDDDDNRTPDFIFKRRDDLFHVVELATCRSPDYRSLMRSYSMKEYSYLGAVENRAINVAITYTIVIVSPQSVLSNVPITEDMATDLVTRYRIGLALDNKAEAHSIDLEDDERSQFEANTQKSIMVEVHRSKWAKDTNFPLAITKDYIDSCLSEPNEKLASKAFIEEMIKIEQRDLTPDHANKIQSYIDSYSEGERRSDLKPVTFFPFIVSKPVTPTVDIQYRAIPEHGELPHVSKLWSKAMDYYQLEPNIHKEDPMSLLKEALEEDLDSLRAQEVARSEGKKKYHRVDLRSVVDTRVECELALQGLWAKKHKGTLDYVMRRKHQQSAFKWGTSTDDILQYLESTVELEETQEPLSDGIVDLLTRANRLAGNPSDGIDCIQKWRKTPLMRSMEIISDIAYEVAIANKQHCKAKTMILKKLRHFNVYMLLSPTRSSEHCFCSLFIPKGAGTRILHAGCFGRTFKNAAGHLTDFFSIKQGKLENQSSMPSAVITMAAFWSWFYLLPDSTPQSFRDHAEASFMLKLSLLVRLEDKSSTEETITASRYMYMEMFKSIMTPLLPPDPFKVLSKITSYPRSRLNLFLIHRLINGFQMMVSVPPMRLEQGSIQTMVDGEDSLPKDAWVNLVNWMSHGGVKSASKAINLAYLGYLKNKNETAEGNTDFQLIEKTCEEEFSFDWSQLGSSMGHPHGKPKGKQFSLNSIKHGCSIMEKRLKDMFGPGWREIIQKDLYKNLSYRMTSEVASLKASANLVHSKSYPTASTSDSFSAERIKVLQAVHRKLEKFGLNPMMHISSILDSIETTTKGVVSDLFKKQQHGGLREIYVLTIESRIVQLFVETISRTLCSYFEEETLTHPYNKLRKLDEHRSFSLRQANRDSCAYIDFCSSTDKARWNQNFVMPAMAVPLFRLTTKEFHPLIQRILNLWSRKLIRLPQRVINLLIRDTEMQSETYKELKRMFDGRSKGHSCFDAPGQPFLRLCTGMMQGILHYTSSLLHLSFLNSSSSIVHTYLSSIYKKFKFRITQVCSSDDSATILSVFNIPGSTSISTEFLACLARMPLVMEGLNELAPYYCMKNSVKSTTGLIDYVEFNSEFLFRNTLAMAIIKFAVASLNVTESESFPERFHTMYNLISDLFSSGFPAVETHLCQLSQAMNHYKTLGSSVNVLFPNWCESIQKIPDPALGFFLLDCSLCPGVMGYSFSHWKAVTLAPIFHRKLRDVVVQACEINDAGGVINTLILKQGEVKKWKSMAKEILGDMDLVREMEEHPEVLVRAPVTMAELRLDLAIKATMPSVGKSLRKGNPYMQALAMSVYAINTHCFSLTSVTMDLTEGISKTFSKTSLLLELERRIRALNESVPPTAEELQIAFPSMSRYQEADSVMVHMRKSQLVQCHRFRHKRTEITVQPLISVLPLTLMQIATHKWFGYNIKTSHRIGERCWAAYCARLTWLEDDIHRTLDKSPFSTYQELINFIKMQTLRTRRFVRVGPGINSQRLKGQLYQLIKKSQRDCHVLRDTHKVRTQVGSADLFSKVGLALSLPLPKQRQDSIEELLRGTEPYYDRLSSISEMTKREANLAFIHSYMRGDYSIEDITTAIQQTGTGLIYSYTKMQKKIVTDKATLWRGAGQVIIMAEGLRLIVDMYDEEATTVTVSSWTKLRGSPSLLKMVLAELGLRPARTYGCKPGCLARFDGSRWIHPRSMGVPVMEERELDVKMRDIPQARLEVSFQSIALMQETPRGPAAMIRFNSYPGDIMMNSSGRSDDDIQSAWLNQSNLRPDSALRILMDLNRARARRRHKFQERLGQWVKETLLSRLTQRGFSRSSRVMSAWIPSDVPEQEIQATEIDDDDLTALLTTMMENPLKLQVILDEFDQVNQPPEILPDGQPVPWAQLVEEDAEVKLKETSPWLDVLHNWMDIEAEENIKVTDMSSKAFKFLHPFWDSLIDHFERESNRFWIETLDGYVSSVDPSSSKTIMRVLEIERKHGIQTLYQRAMRAPSEIDRLIGWAEESEDPITEDSTLSSPGSSSSEISVSQDGDSVENPVPDESGMDLLQGPLAAIPKPNEQLEMPNEEIEAYWDDILGG